MVDVSQFKPFCPDCWKKLTTAGDVISCPDGHHSWKVAMFDSAWEKFAESAGAREDEGALYDALNKSNIAENPVELRLP